MSPTEIALEFPGVAPAVMAGRFAALKRAGLVRIVSRVWRSVFYEPVVSAGEQR
jgi:hypothetical protein